MTGGKLWSLSEWKRPRDLVKEGRNNMEIAEIMNKTFESIRMKIWNLGLSLKEEASAKQHACSSSLDMSQGLLSA